MFYLALLELRNETQIKSSAFSLSASFPSPHPTSSQSFRTPPPPPPFLTQLTIFVVVVVLFNMDNAHNKQDTAQHHGPNWHWSKT
mmetsp:Transcript_4473/g.7499  ORF Transcript_4473/g.7499 Transcript_4473/m.7499 type:complete len:85 (-) Transcript_4473:1621-1875(-)